MRLTQIKLAGFKSFVDPTHVKVPGDLVGVVGPNGCGKSNIIDAVRWVLGESRASALRGDSMQDVIFNGSTLRKPVARASVELIFDNSLGRAAGQWSQYSEIAVKRVLTREGESSYLINNTHVRRRDIHDIFMGTGLGPRAYAIIEQGMISRIIEAKPEELRVFLEEAAGISKYKDRRRETENRLSDTRENLSRVGDIRQELGNQIEKLERQAEVARRYNELSEERQQRQTLLWALRRQEAEAERQNHHKDGERLANELEAETARLRQTEKELEVAREEHYAAGDALSAAQGALYGANAEVARLETEIRFVAESRQRIEAQIAHLTLQLENGARQRSELSDALSLWETRSGETAERTEIAKQDLEAQRAVLPEREQALRELRATVERDRESLVQAERALHLEQSHLNHAERILQDLLARSERLQTERAGLLAPDESAIQSVQEALDSLRVELVQLAEASELAEEQRVKWAREVSIADEALRKLEREQSGILARFEALQRIQRQVDDNGKIHDWLLKWNLDGVERLWQKIHVEPGWEVAVEAVLRDRLHALEKVDDRLLASLLNDPPPARLIAMAEADLELPLATNDAPGLPKLISLVRSTDFRIECLINIWLANVYAIEDNVSPVSRDGIPPGVILVNRAGHQFSNMSVTFHAPETADAGILARQREIGILGRELEELEERINTTRAALEDALRRQQSASETLSKAATTLRDLRQREHEYRVEQVQLQQASERFHQRNMYIESELSELEQKQIAELEAKSAAESELSRHSVEAAAARERLEQSAAMHARAADALEEQRRNVADAERGAQEALFAARECASKLEELRRMLGSAVDLAEQQTDQLESLNREAAELQDAGAREQLQGALQVRSEKEAALTAARSMQEEAAIALKGLEETRLATEKKLDPLRERVAETRLKMQAAQLSVEQFSAYLSEAGLLDESVTALLSSAREGQKASSLQGEITRLSNAISELGAINMAALEELDTSLERKTFLDAQAEDLSSALETLEGAIRKIDRETRELLQNTFNTVNRHFGELFPALFGGGEARLTMTGEEVLDSGVVVTARPPGKKNSTIHLLSGGEKALTAIALVFSFFHLNPAPFCLLDEVDAPLDDANTVRFCDLVSKMSRQTQFLYISHNKITMEMATHLVGVTMQEQGVSRVVAVDMDEAMRLREPAAA